MTWTISIIKARAMKYYILNGIHPVAEPDSVKFAKWYFTDNGGNNRRIGLTKTDDFTISTVFLGVSHTFSFKDPPMLFETLITNSEGEEIDMLRYSQYNEALVYHNILSEMAENSCQKEDFKLVQRHEHCEFVTLGMEWLPLHKYDVKVDSFLGRA